MKVLLVCMGNICRSPTAEAVVRHYLEISGLAPIVTVDSAGVTGYHTGEPPDPRAQRAAAQRGFDLSKIRARRVRPDDYHRFDLILAMDRDNLKTLERNCPSEQRGKLALFTRYARRNRDAEVPDPYYGGPEGFHRVLDMLEDAASGLVQELRGKVPVAR